MYRALTAINFGTFPDVQPGELIDLTPETAKELVELGVVESLADDESATAGASLPPVSLSPPSDGTDAALPKGSFLINLNNAWHDELMQLPHIGKAVAARLVAAQPFATLDEAQRASGLSATRWAEVLPLVTL
ncbi:MAG: hypothetical protein KME14_20345 [Tildeniella torsiva UHER 1998/13D]|jgi:DNA uptake protein ComE-like DNA-binding protein|nr:hypothetical protein [Tildeniella torsiva UHER 1998/13D]